MSAVEHLGKQWYHGTDADLSPGDRLRPASEIYPGERPSHSLWDRVSITSDPDEAQNYGRRVYRVHPEGSPDLDPEYAKTRTGWHVTGARVLGEHASP